MATLQDLAEDYLQNLNPLAKRFSQEMKKLNLDSPENLSECDYTKQEDKIDGFFIQKPIQDLYSTDTKAINYMKNIICFPKYPVQCGEKIIIDFENDGWTWRDEHSSPFSWMTRSQQDLSSIGLDEIEEDEGIEKDKKSQKCKRIQKSRSPERSDHQAVNLAFKPEKSIWESPFLAADRGLDSAYPSSQASEQSRVSDDSEELSPKQGSLSLHIDEDIVDSQLHSPDNADTTILLSSPSQKQVDSTNARHNSTKKDGDISDLSSPSEIKVPRDDFKVNKKMKDSGSNVKKLWNPLRKEEREAEQSLILDLNSSVNSSISKASSSSGQVSPVYIEDPGESSTEIITSSFTTEDDCVQEHSEQLPSNFSTEEDKNFSLPKSGFDFLDEW